MITTSGVPSTTATNGLWTHGVLIKLCKGKKHYGNRSNESTWIHLKLKQGTHLKYTGMLYICIRINCSWVHVFHVHTIKSNPPKNVQCMIKVLLFYSGFFLNHKVYTTQSSKFRNHYTMISYEINAWITIWDNLHECAFNLSDIYTRI